MSQPSPRPRPRQRPQDRPQERAEGRPEERPEEAPAGPAEYASTVVAPIQIVFGVLSGAVLALVLLAIDSGLWPFAILGFLVVTGAGVYLATVSLIVAPGRVTIGQGRREREPRVIYAREIDERSVATFTWGQCFGFGLPRAERTTRLSVRPGPTLCITTTDGEVIRISTADPAAALSVLDRSPAR